MKSMLSVNLGKLRKEKKLSQRQAAAQFGVSQALLSHYENDAREPGVEFIKKACDFYSVTADYLIGRTKERADSATILSAKVNEAVDLLEELRLQESKIINSIREMKIEE